MKKSLFLLLTLLAVQAFGQNVPRFAKHDISATGCAVYLPTGEEVVFDVSESEDGSQVYTGEVEHENYFFAVICVEFKEPIGDNKEDNVALLEGYLDFLQGQFGITGSAGYGEGHTLESHPAATGVIDYWEDAEQVQYAVKGWVDNNFMAVLLLYGPEEYPIYNVQDMFLNGFRFPEQ